MKVELGYERCCSFFFYISISTLASRFTEPCFSMKNHPDVTNAIVIASSNCWMNEFKLQAISYYNKRIKYNNPSFSTTSQRALLLYMQHHYKFRLTSQPSSGVIIQRIPSVGFLYEFQRIRWICAKNISVKLNWWSWSLYIQS
jgi:hypothetical protein